MPKPKCPACGAKDGEGLWNDNLWEGCNRCGYLYSVDKGWVNRGGDRAKMKE